MLTAKLSILGLYNEHPEIFSGMTLPGDIDRDTLLNNLLMELAELEIVYPNPAFMKSAIEAWSAKQVAIWQKLVDTTKLDYNPLNNYDRTETWEDDITDDGENSSNATSKIAAFNAEPLQDTGAETSAGTSKNTRKVKHTAKISGNIGVTTSQEMLQAERDIAAFSVYDYIINDFKNRFCILVY